MPHKYCLALRHVFAECHHSESTETVIYYGFVIKSFNCKRPLWSHSLVISTAAFEEGEQNVFSEAAACCTNSSASPGLNLIFPWYHTLSAAQREQAELVQPWSLHRKFKSGALLAAWAAPSSWLAAGRLSCLGNQDSGGTVQLLSFV